MKIKRAKIWTDEEIEQLLKLRSDKLSPDKIGKILKVGETLVYRKLIDLGVYKQIKRGDKIARPVIDAQAFEHFPKLTPLEQAKRNLGSRWRYDPFNGYTVRDKGGNWKPVTVQAMIEMGAE